MSWSPSQHPRDSRGRFASSTHTAGRRQGVVTGSFRRYPKRRTSPGLGFDDNVSAAHAQQRAAIMAVRRRYAAEQRRR